MPPSNFWIQVALAMVSIGLLIALSVALTRGSASVVLSDHGVDGETIFGSVPARLEDAVLSQRGDASPNATLTSSSVLVTVPLLPRSPSAVLFLSAPSNLVVLRVGLRFSEYVRQIC